MMAKFQYMLAPIEDMTDSAFRTLCHRHGADLTFTELSRIQPLGKAVQNTLKRIRIMDSTPTFIQLLGDSEQFLKKFLSKFEPEKGFKGFNLNLGCPNPSVVAQGDGCAMITRISKTRKIAAIIRDNSYPLSIKLRLGLTKVEKEKKAYLNLIDAVEADFYIVHARYGTQSYIEPADFSVYPELANLGKVIIANGDIKTKEQIDSLKELGINGAMIGRAAISDPSIFSRLKGEPVPSQEMIKKEYLELTQKYGTEFRYQKNILKWLSSADTIYQEQ
jgi:tRNA-dihydrouridine synthase B